MAFLPLPSGNVHAQFQQSCTLFIYLANAKSFSHAVASESAEWRVASPPLSLWRGQASMMCSIVCSSPQAHSGLGQLPHLWPCPVLNLLRVDHCLRGSSVPGTGWVGSDTRCLLRTSLESHSFSQADWMVKSAAGGFFQMGRLDRSRAVGGLRMS